MKEISQAEFEAAVRKLIEGETTLKQLCKEFHTSYSSLNARITQLSDTNPKLYEEYITKFPYKPKSNTQINGSGIIIEIMKDGSSIEQIHEKYGIPKRTIDRKIAETKKTDPDLYDVYKIYRKNPKDSRNNELIASLIREPILGDKSAAEIKQEEIQEILQQYEELITKYKISKEAAAARLGFLPQQIFEMRRKVDRISKEKQFRQSQRVDVQPMSLEKEKTKQPKENEMEK